MGGHLGCECSPLGSSVSNGHWLVSSKAGNGSVLNYTNLGFANCDSPCFVCVCMYPSIKYAYSQAFQFTMLTGLKFVTLLGVYCL